MYMIPVIQKMKWGKDKLVKWPNSLIYFSLLLKCCNRIWSKPVRPGVRPILSRSLSFLTKKKKKKKVGLVVSVGTVKIKLDKYMKEFYKLKITMKLCSHRRFAQGKKATQFRRHQDLEVFETYQHLKNPHPFPVIRSWQTIWCLPTHFRLYIGDTIIYWYKLAIIICLVLFWEIYMY